MLFNSSMKRLLSETSELISFDDMLIRPTYTSLESRSIPDTTSDVAGFKLSLPIISSPMNTITEHRMAIEMSLLGAMGIVHRFMSIEDQLRELDIIKKYEDSEGVKIKKVFAVGVGDSELLRAKSLIDSGVDAVAIDVANGHSSYMKKAISLIKEYNSDIKIIAGNVSTDDGYMFLAGNGADAVRVGIGGGCFVPGTRVLTKEGYKKIEDISIGDLVITHTASWKPVINTMTFDRDELIVSINDIKCTKNHEFYVVNKSDAALLTEDNIHQYAFWIEADHLDESKHLLIELD